MVLISGARELRFDTSLVMEEDEESAGRNLIYYKFTLSMCLAAGSSVSRYVRPKEESSPNTSSLHRPTKILQLPTTIYIDGHVPPNPSPEASIQAICFRLICKLFAILYFPSKFLAKKNGSKLPEEEHPKQAFGWAARDESGVLSPFNFSRRATGEKDVCFKVLYCGMCHSDLHMVKNEWGIPLTLLSLEVGSKVEKFKVGDKVGVGCIVGSCHSCHNCTNNLENYCAEMILTYGAKYYDGTITYGGPLKYYGLDKPGMHVGVVGLGGLGHMAVKFAKGMGVKVTVISTSPSKKQEAVEHLGADSFLVSRDQDQMKATMGTMDGIIDTVSATHPLLPLIGLLKTNGKLILVGAPEKPLELAAFPLLMAKHNITADIEVIPIEYVNTAMERMLKADVRYRFVIDISNTIKSTH
ncbi:hypothetical protein GH714_014796 [Hevea brasiliensis]|uniref:Enoyl reductase (ER) domain-containing protein n=1 Tax=Hevea brasiliensis TaxID=3981 RepID=A0A6A6KNS3_HEVBR|nr:hypothetical protein GH714_014796 [Hevea brasiliensis]